MVAILEIKLLIIVAIIALVLSGIWSWFIDRKTTPYRTYSYPVPKTNLRPLGAQSKWKK